MNAPNRPSLLGVINDHPVMTLFVVFAVCNAAISIAGLLR